MVEAVLRERFGFTSPDITILKDEKATHNNIETAFKDLADRITENDFVYIHYSGHGSETKDENGDERSGKDQTWVSYGSRARRGDAIDKDNYDVLDDEIEAWLSEIYQKTSHLVFVSDSCHSATVYRGNEAFTRHAPEDKRPHLLGRTKYLRPQQERGVRIGSAQEFESAVEIKQDDGKVYGLFTWHWVKALHQSHDKETWNDVFKRAYAQVTAFRGTSQRPQLSGDRSTDILGENFNPLPDTVAVTRVWENKAEINVGSLVGVTSGSLYRLYKPNIQKKSTLPSLKITHTATYKSHGQVKGVLKTGDLLIEESHVYPYPSIPVYLYEDNVPKPDKSLLQVIRSVFQNDIEGQSKLSAYTLTDNKNEAELYMVLLRPKKKDGQDIRISSNDPLPQYFPKQSPELRILTPDMKLYHNKLRISFVDPVRGVQVLKDNLNQLLRIRELRALRNRRNIKIPLSVQVSLLTPVDKCQEGPDCLFLDHNSSFYSVKGPYTPQEIAAMKLNKGVILSFDLINKSHSDYYIYLVNIAPDGAIYAIFPPKEERAEYALVKSGETRSLLNDVGLEADRVGEEMIKILITRQPIDIALIEHEGFKQRGGAKGRYTPIEHLLVNVLHGQRGPVSLRNDSWKTNEMSFIVKE